MQSISHNVNLSDCWLCVTLPNSVGHRTQLVRVPIPRNKNWEKYWQNTTFADAHEEHVWDISLPTGADSLPTQYIQRCYPPDINTKNLCKKSYVCR